MEAPAGDNFCRYFAIQQAQIQLPLLLFPVQTGEHKEQGRGWESCCEKCQGGNQGFQRQIRADGDTMLMGRGIRTLPTRP